jgi:hypothetical protein
MTDREYILRIRLPPKEDSKRANRRLRAALKLLLRTFQIRCVSCEPAGKPVPLTKEPKR